VAAGDEADLNDPPCIGDTFVQSIFGDEA